VTAVVFEAAIVLEVEIVSAGTVSEVGTETASAAAVGATEAEVEDADEVVASRWIR
jgi:hypothetical protein